jgi:hypothetical protein
MPTLSYSLSIWEIAHRWSGLDPDDFRLKLSFLVKDYSKLMLDAVLNGHLYCESLVLFKRPNGSNADPKFFIRTHLDEINACLHHGRYDRKLLKWAHIPRHDFKEWCERMCIPLPDFWFPLGWKDHFVMPEFGTRAFWASHVEPDEPGGVGVRFEIPDIQEWDASEPALSEDIIQPLRINQKSKLCAQQIAITIWKELPDRSIAEMARDEIIRKYSGAAHYNEDTIKGWLAEIAPVTIKGKRGRPRKKSDGDLE